MGIADRVLGKVKGWLQKGQRPTVKHYVTDLRLPEIPRKSRAERAAERREKRRVRCEARRVVHADRMWQKGPVRACWTHGKHLRRSDRLKQIEAQSAEGPETMRKAA